MIPGVTIFVLWSVCWVILRNIVTTLSILRVEGCKIAKIIMVWLDPVLFIITLPMVLQWDRRNQQGGNNEQRQEEQAEDRSDNGGARPEAPPTANSSSPANNGAASVESPPPYNKQALYPL